MEFMTLYYNTEKKHNTSLGKNHFTSGCDDLYINVLIFPIKDELGHTYCNQRNSTDLLYEHSHMISNSEL